MHSRSNAELRCIDPPEYFSRTAEVEQRDRSLPRNQRNRERHSPFRARGGETGGPGSPGPSETRKRNRMKFVRQRPRGRLQRGGSGERRGRGKEEHTARDTPGSGHELGEENDDSRDLRRAFDAAYRRLPFIPRGSRLDSLRGD